MRRVGGAMLVPGSLSLITASFRTEDHGAAIGAWSGLTGAATAIGPFLGGWLVDAVSWRLVFLINVPLAAVALFVTLRHVPESRDPQAGKRPDFIGAGTATVGLGGLVYALIQGPAHGWSPFVVALGVIGASGTIVVRAPQATLDAATQLLQSLDASRPEVMLDVHVYQVSRRPGLLKTFGNHEGDRLAVTRHLRACEDRVRFTVVAGALRGCVAMGENQRNARRLLRSTRIDRYDPSRSDRGFDDKAVQRVLLLHFVGVARAARNLQSAVHAVEGLADNALCVECIRADG